MPERSLMLQRFVCALGLLLCACKQPMAAPPPPAHPSQVAAPSPQAAPEDQPPPKDPFALDEDTDDPAAALEGMRHNCCDEMPANEIREHTGDAPSPKSK